MTSSRNDKASPEHRNLLQELRRIVGQHHVLAGSRAIARYASGYRCGGGQALAVVRPASLLEQWRVAQACVRAGAIVIMQAANTGLTGGSTPFGTYDRPVVIISTTRIKGCHLIRSAHQVICLPGTTLYDLEEELSAHERIPHSVIGSSCIGATVLGGVCNNSGGALIQRGPAYTDFALFAEVGPDGELRLVNHLGIDLGEEPERMLARLEHGQFSEYDISDPAGYRASVGNYTDIIRDIEAETPARYNANPDHLHEASGCAGKLIVFAVRLDTFPKEGNSRYFYIGTNDPLDLSTLRRNILAGCKHLPLSAEYVHREAFDMAARYGKDMFRVISWFGTRRLPFFFALKARTEAIARIVGLRQGCSDRILYTLFQFLPLGPHLPKRLRDYRDRYEHHLMIHASDGAAAEIRACLDRTFPSRTGDCFECTEEEGKKAFLHRFVVAGAAIRYQQVHAGKVGELIALDIALPRNTRDWFEVLPPELEDSILLKAYYGHFFCQVFHQDYIVKRGTDAEIAKSEMLRLLELRGAKYPAEHNVGHTYRADPPLEAFYRKLDPCNQLNPGIGKTSRNASWT